MKKQKPQPPAKAKSPTQPKKKSAHLGNKILKPTKQQLAEVMQVYNAYWASYLKGGIKTIDSLLDNDYNRRNTFFI